MTILNTAVAKSHTLSVACWTSVLAALGGLLVTGCRHDAAPAGEATAAEVALTPVNAPGLAEAVANCRGKVVLVEFWATWCAPCVKLFPHAVELHRRLADQGFVVISVSIDDTEKREDVLQFLRNHQAESENFISQYGLGAEGFEAFNIGDGALPHLKLYDRDGRLQKTFASGSQPLDPEQVELAVADLLNRTR